MTRKVEATVDDLYRVPDHGKAELINGEIVAIPLAGYWPGHAASAIFISLRERERTRGSGRAIGGNAAFVVDLPRRRSFSPDAAWYTGRPTRMRFLEGAPAFAVEVRSEEDYGPAAERRLAEKRRDYFAAGTLCVWDVDLLSPDIVKAYHHTDPENPVIFRRGEIADAGDAVPGWSILVDDFMPGDE